MRILSWALIGALAMACSSGGSSASGGSSGSGGIKPDGQSGTGAIGGSATGGTPTTGGSGAIDGAVGGAGGAVGGQSGSGGASTDAGDAVYPECWSEASKRRLFPCTETQTCVEDCATCSKTPKNCVSIGSIPSGNCEVSSFNIAERSCVASCETCTNGPGGAPLPDECNNTCTDFKKDFCNCGGCGTVCGNGPTVGSCSVGHCCAQLPAGGITSWSEECKLCCVTTCPLVPEIRKQQCQPPM